MQESKKKKKKKDKNDYDRSHWQAYLVFNVLDLLQNRHFEVNAHELNDNKCR
jgi:hypothetical protein